MYKRLIYCFLSIFAIYPLAVAQAANTAPKISVSAKAVNFEPTKTGSSSSPKSFTIRNKGRSDLTINEIRIIGANPSDFHQINSCNNTLPRNSSCAVVITFTPMNPLGNMQAQLAIYSNDPKKSTIRVTLSGTALQGDVVNRKIEVLPTGLNPHNLVSYDNYLYWLEDSDTPLNRISLSGGSTTPIITARIGSPANIVIHGQFMYWIEIQDRVVRVLNKTALDGTSTMKLAEGPNSYEPAMDIIVDDEFVYWVTGDSSTSGPIASINRVPISGGASTVVATSGSIYSLLGDAENIYWEGQSDVYSAYRIYKMSKSGGIATILWNSKDQEYAWLVLHGTDLFVVGNNNGYKCLMKVTISDGSVTTLAIVGGMYGTDRIYNLTADDEYLYWTKQDLYLYNDTINRIPINGGDVVTLVNYNGSKITGIYVTNEKIYWMQAYDRVEYGGMATELFQVKSYSIIDGSVSIIAQNLIEPDKFAGDADNLFWTEGSDSLRKKGASRIMKMPFAGGQVTTLVSGINSTTFAPFMIVGGSMYIADGYAIKKMAPEGGALETIYYRDVDDPIYTDGVDIFWIGMDPFYPYIARMTLDGTVTSRVTVDKSLTDNGSNARCLLSNGYFYCANYNIKKISVNGGDVTTLVTSGLPAFRGMVVSNNYLYYQKSSSLYKVSVNGGTSTLVSGGYQSLSMDSDFLYLTDSVGNLMKIRKSDDTVVLMTRLPLAGYALTSYGQSTYWVSGTSIWRATPKY